jgi:hypothetical protein
MSLKNVVLLLSFNATMMKIMLCLKIFLAVSLSLSAFVADARVLDTYELAVGEWKFTLRGRFDPSLLFPTTSVGSHRTIRPLQTKRRPWGSNLECTLSILEDGTFSVVPKDYKTGRMPLRGKWKSLPNPYCITDRSFDQLTLESYPRVQKQRLSWSEEKELQTVALVLQCRMSGHYNAGGIFHKLRPNYARGRLTHGTLRWDKKEVKDGVELPWWRKRRAIVASFSALRPSNQPETDGLEDKDLFGY